MLFPSLLWYVPLWIVLCIWIVAVFLWDIGLSVWEWFERVNRK